MPTTSQSVNYLLIQFGRWLPKKVQGSLLVCSKETRRDNLLLRSPWDFRLHHTAFISNPHSWSAWLQHNTFLSNFLIVSLFDKHYLMSNYPSHLILIFSFFLFLWSLLKKKKKHLLVFSILYGFSLCVFSLVLSLSLVAMSYHPHVLRFPSRRSLLHFLFCSTLPKPNLLHAINITLLYWL